MESDPKHSLPLPIRHSAFGIDPSFVIRHSSFVIHPLLVPAARFWYNAQPTKG